ncbi:MAG: DNA-3-methyladenine glycosylase family protein [Flammeovirgaceae bacterium]
MNKEIITHLSSHDPILKQINSQVVPLTNQSTKNVFHDLVSCIIEQQIHYRSTKKIFTKQLAASSLPELTPQNFHQMEFALSQLKLSQRKFETLALTVDFFQKNQLNWLEMDEQTVRNTLARIKGIGKWTIDMILLFTLERPNIFPVDDYRLKKVMMKLYELQDGKTLRNSMIRLAKNWEPYRSFGVRFLLAWHEQNKGNN